MNFVKLDYSKPIIPNGNFTWGEFLWLPRLRKHADLTPSQVTNAVFLFTELQKMRTKLGKPLIITSGIRTHEYTKLLRRQGVPAALRSAHNEAMAVDITCPIMTTKQLWHWMDKNWAGRMELLAFTPTWVHLDTRNWGKRQRFKP